MKPILKDQRAIPGVAVQPKLAHCFRPPAPPPHYQPHAVPAKVVAVIGAHRLPAVPPVYRPQGGGTVVQNKAAIIQAAQDERKTPAVAVSAWAKPLVVPSGPVAGAGASTSGVGSAPFTVVSRRTGPTNHEKAVAILRHMQETYGAWDGRSKLDTSYTKAVHQAVLEELEHCYDTVKGTYGLREVELLPWRDELRKSTLNFQADGLASASELNPKFNYHVYKS